MIFPADLSPFYRFTIDFYQYSRESLLSIGDLGSVGQVVLPLPTSLSDSYNVTYETEPMGTALGAGADGALKGLNVSDKFTGGVGGAVAGLAANAGLTGEFGKLASAALGQTANPFMTVLFKSPNYKEYSFSWRLFPKNQHEANIALSMVNAFRYHALPGQVGGVGGSVFTYPSLIKCAAYVRGGILYPFKYGVIKNVTFNYAPDGTPSFHTDGRPSAIDVKIDCQEVEYFLKDDVPFGKQGFVP